MLAWNLSTHKSTECGPVTRYNLPSLPKRKGIFPQKRPESDSKSWVLDF